MLTFFLSVVVGSLTILGPLLLILGWMLYREKSMRRWQVSLIGVTGLVFFALGLVSLVFY